MEAVDPEYHKSLVWILENDITDILDLTFSTEIDEFGQVRNNEFDNCDNHHTLTKTHSKK